jgi:methylenetetrahydrofolate reductase (NADPH)
MAWKTPIMTRNGPLCNVPLETKKKTAPFAAHRLCSGTMKPSTIRELLAARQGPTLSLEFYPPKDPLGFGILGGSIERMRPVHPDFVTCTYGAGGSGREFSFAAWELLARMGFTPVVAHLTCVGASRDDLAAQIHRIHDAGIRNIMALRGDPPRGETQFTPAPNGLAHASDLVALVKSLHPDVCCGVAGYPEIHPEAPSLADDLRHLKAKLDAGADFVNTQLFFDNDAYFRFLDAARAAGISAPILPGLMPVASPAQLDRALAFSRATAPDALRDALATAPDAEAARRVGMQWLVGQIDGLIANGAPGIHLYILNQPKNVLDPLLAASIHRWRPPPT